MNTTRPVRPRWRCICCCSIQRLKIQSWGEVLDKAELCCTAVVCEGCQKLRQDCCTAAKSHRF